MGMNMNVSEIALLNMMAVFVVLEEGQRYIDRARGLQMLATMPMNSPLISHKATDGTRPPRSAPRSFFPAKKRTTS